MYFFLGPACFLSPTVGTSRHFIKALSQRSPTKILRVIALLPDDSTHAALLMLQLKL